MLSTFLASSYSSRLVVVLNISQHINGPSKRFRRQCWLLMCTFSVCAIYWAVFSSAGHTSDVYIVDTIDREASKALGNGLIASCTSCGDIKYRQMNGNLRVARRIANELLREEKAGRLSLVVTLGRPATQVVAERLTKTPVLYTFVGQELKKYNGSSRIYGLPTDAPLMVQLNILRRLLPDMKSAGVVVGASSQELERHADSHDSIRLNIYRIEDQAELPKALRIAVQMNDALIVLRDRMVVNNDSIKFLLQHTLENGLHTIAYSGSLVDMGFASALVPSPQAFGRHLGLIANSLLRGEPPKAPLIAESDYRLHTNSKVLEQLKRQVIRSQQQVLVHNND